MLLLLVLLVLARIMDPAEAEIKFEFPGVIRIYKSGHAERLSETNLVPPGVDIKTGVTSKDVVINPSTGISARIYLPKLPQHKKLPIIVYCHGGAFVLGSAFHSPDHAYMNRLTSQASAVAVSVEYRLAPENPVSIQYNDTLEALKWVTSHVNSGSDRG
jgi:acetyl esterase/lipase